MLTNLNSPRALEMRKFPPNSFTGAKARQLKLKEHDACLGDGNTPGGLFLRRYRSCAFNPFIVFVLAIMQLIKRSDYLS